MKEQEIRLTIQAQKPYAQYGGIFMPTGETDIERVEKSSQTPAAGKKGYKPQADKTEEEDKTETVFSQQEMSALKRMRKLHEAREKLKAVEKKLQELSPSQMKLDTLRELIQNTAVIAKIAGKQKAGAIGGNIYAQAIEIESKALGYKALLSSEYKRKGGDVNELNNKFIKIILEALDIKDKEEEVEESKTGEIEIFESGNKQRPVTPEQEEVLENARLNDAERISRAQQLLDRELSPKEKDALLKAHMVGLGELGKDGRPAGVYNYTRQQLEEKISFLKADFNERNEWKKLMKAGLAGVAVPREAFVDFDTAPYVGTPLAPFAEELKSLGDSGFADEASIEDIAKRIVRPGGVPVGADRNEFLAELGRFKNLAGRTEGREREGHDEQYLTNEDVSAITEDKFDADTYIGSDTRIRDIANIIGNALRTGAPPVGNEFLLGQLKELLPLMVRDDLPDDVRADTNRLFREIDKLKNEVIAKNARTAEARSGRGTLYGEIRMSEFQKGRLVDLAKIANPNPLEGTQAEKDEAIFAWREIEEMFNKNFSQADVNSSDPWREALGGAADYEIKEFFRVLSNASESKTMVLTIAEKERVRETSRRLKQEMELREYLHDLSYRVNINAGAEDIIKSASVFKAEDADVAFRKRGVAQILHWYEDAMLQVMAQNGGYLPGTAMINTPEGKYGPVEEIVLKQAERAKEIGALPRDITDWEIRRAISLARGMGIVTGRFFEIVAEHGIPKNNALNSWWANGLVKNIAFFRQVARFNHGQLQNAVLGYRLEGWKTKMPWSTSELKQFKSMTTAQVLDNLVNEGNEDRLIQMKNPFHIGSIFTQTGWRWKNDSINLSSATSHLLQEDENNPLIGVGLLIEAKRGDLAQHEDKAKQKKAHDIVHKNLELASEITPLKLFYNLTGLRQDVLRKYYSGDIKEDIKKAKGSIFIESPQLQDDLKVLALVQEKLLNERLRIYQEDLAAKKADPNYKFRQLPTELDFGSIVTGIDTSHREPSDEVRNNQRDQADRIQKLTEHIGHEFHAKHMETLLHNLEHKGWKVPWVLGTDDIPYAALNFSAVPGDTIARRWSADILPVVKTAELYSNFIGSMSEFKSAGDIVKSMKNIHNTLSSHDPGVANETIRYLAEGVAKFYKKDWYTRLPVGVGTVSGFLGGNASYAQIAFGRGQMAWDELDLQAFLHHIHASGLVDHHQYNELKSRLGARGYNLAWAGLRSGGPLLLLGFLYMMLSEQMEDLKKIK